MTSQRNIVCLAVVAVLALNSCTPAAVGLTGVSVDSEGHYFAVVDGCGSITKSIKVLSMKNTDVLGVWDSKNATTDTVRLNMAHPTADWSTRVDYIQPEVGEMVEVFSVLRDGADPYVSRGVIFYGRALSRLTPGHTMIGDASGQTNHAPQVIADEEFHKFACAS